jgi:hypothetical protein
MNLYKLMKTMLFEQGEFEKAELTTYNEDDIKGALSAEKPEIELKKVFGMSFWPKIQRYLENELKVVNLDKADKNLIGGELKARLNIFLEKGTPRFEENLKAMTRGIVNSYKRWSEMQNKSMDLPDDNVMKGGQYGRE